MSILREIALSYDRFVDLYERRNVWREKIIPSHNSTEIKNKFLQFIKLSFFYILYIRQIRHFFLQESKLTKQKKKNIENEESCYLTYVRKFFRRIFVHRIKKHKRCELKKKKKERNELLVVVFIFLFIPDFVFVKSQRYVRIEGA